MSSIGRKLVLLGELMQMLSDELILKGKKLPKLGDKVYDEQLRDVGYVSNIFGPVNSFFVAVKLTGNDSYKQGSKFFLME